MTELRRKVFVLLSHDQDLSAWRERHQRSESWDRTPYGYDLAEESLAMTWSTGKPESALSTRVRTSLAGRLGFDVVHVWRNRKAIRRADVVWTHTEREHLALALLVRLHVIRWRPTIAQSVWLWDSWDQRSPLWRRGVSWLLESHRVETVHSPLNLERSRTRVPGREVRLIPFGSQGIPQGAVETRAIEPVRKGEVIAVGNDMHRDWELLAGVAEQMPETHFTVVSTSKRATARRWPANVTLLSTRSTSELAAAYSAADVAVLPLHENLHASGATTCIEALSVGLPIVASRAGGIECYLSKESIAVAIGDRRGFADAITSLLPIGRSGVDARMQSGLRQEDFIARHVIATRTLLSGQDWDPRVSLFEPLDITDGEGAAVLGEST